MNTPVLDQSRTGTPGSSDRDESSGLAKPYPTHSVYPRPNGWDHIPPGKHIPMGESSMWGDYHARELGVMLLRMAKGESYYRFFVE